MAEHRTFDAPQLSARFQSQLLAEQHAGSFVRGEGVSLPTAPVQRDHQLAPEPFPERMLAHQHLELSDEFAMLTGREVGREPSFERARVLLAQADRLGGQGRV